MNGRRRRNVLSAAAVSLLLAGQAGMVWAGSPRGSLKLDGVWQSAPGNVDDEGHPPDQGWRRLAVPHWKKGLVDGAKCPVRWYRRTVRAPAEWRGKEIILRFEAVHYKATVFWNGGRVGAKVASFLPMEFAVTRFVRFGSENELLVRVEGVTAVRRKRGDRYVFTEPVAAGYNEAGPTVQGIWWSVYLLARPQVHFGDVFVTPSVRSKSLTVKGSIRNDTRLPANLTVWGKVVDAHNRAALVLGQWGVQVDAGGAATFTKTVRWVHPKLWRPDSPTLYRLELTLTDPEGRVVDRLTQRFGFREVWVQGADFFVNGVKFFLRRGADSAYWFFNGRMKPGDTTDSILTRLREGMKGWASEGVNIVRMHYWPPPPEWVRVADEVGLPLIIEGPFMGPGAQAHPLEDEELWSHFADVWAGLAKRYYNSPAVFGYSLENEMFRMQSPRALACKRWRAVRGAVRRIDATRWLWQENGDDVRADLDAPGLHEASSIHLMAADDGIAVPDNPARLIHKWEKGFFNEYQTPCRWPASKPVTIGEWYLNFFGPQLNGERLWDLRYNYENCFWRSRVWAAHAYLAVMRLNGNLRGVDPWRLELNKYGGEEGVHLWPAVDITPDRWVTHAYSGETFPFDATLVFDRFHDDTLTVTYSLRRARQGHASLLSPTPLASRSAPGGKAISKKTLVLEAKAGERYPLHLRVSTPKVTKKTDFMLVVVVAEGSRGRPWVHQWPIRVYPKPRWPSKGLRICCVSDGAAEPLRRLGVAAARVRSKPQSDDDLVVVGRNELASLPARTLRAVADFASKGGVVVILEQSLWRPGALPVSLALRRTRTTSLAFVRGSDSVWMRGLDDFDFRFWRPRGAFVTPPFYKPDDGNVLTLVDSGGPVGLDTAFLLEVRVGRGRFLVCQLPLGQLTGIEPAADAVWTNILRSVREQKRTDARSLGAAGLVSQRRMLNDALADLGVVVRPLTADDLNALSNPERAPRTILVAGEMRPSQESLAPLSRWVRHGGRLVLHGVDPESAAVWTKALGLKFSAGKVERRELTAPAPSRKFPAWRPAPNWRYEQLLADYEYVRPTRRSALLEGLSLEDLTWSDQLGPLMDFRLTDVGDGRVVLSPGALATFRCGAGLVVVDQLRWDRAMQAARGTALRFVAAAPARRYASVLLTQLGVEMNPHGTFDARAERHGESRLLLPVQKARRLTDPDLPFEQGAPLDRYDRVSADRFNYGWVAWRLENIPADRYRLRIHCRVYKPDDPTWGWEMRFQHGPTLPLELDDTCPLLPEDTSATGATQRKALVPKVFHGCLRTKEFVPLGGQGAKTVLVGGRWLSLVDSLELLSSTRTHGSGETGAGL